ncbi:MAG: caspase family protein [Armatimonadota bacterium]
MSRFTLLLATFCILMSLCVGLTAAPAASANKPQGGSAAATGIGITGTVKTAAGATLSGVSVTAGSSSVSTGTDGKYTLILTAGTYTVSAVKTGYTFASVSVRVSNALVTTNFTAATTVGVTGTVQTAAGTALADVLVTAGSSSVSTGTDGKYTLILTAGTYTVTAVKAGYSFAPVSVTVSNAMVTTNFTATVPTKDGVVRYWAVVVGLNTYKSVTALKYCVNDANDMIAVLKAGGYPAANIKLLTDAQATKAAIQSAIAWMATQADGDDVCVYFHSSHGDTGPDVAPLDEVDGKDEYLCTYDTNTTRTLSIRDDELGQWIAALKTTKYVVLLDACYAGGQIKKIDDESGWGSSFARAVNGMSAPGQQRNTKDLDDLGNGVVICSCSDAELSQESSALLNGAFTFYLTLGMTAAAADTNKNGWYSAEEAYNYCAPLTHTFSSKQAVAIYDGYPGELDFVKTSSATLAAAHRGLVVTGTAFATNSGASSIMVSLSAPATVSASIVNLAGREVGVIGDRSLSSGFSTLLWNGKSKQGASVPAGQYLVRLQAKDAAGNCSHCLMGLRK